MFRSSTCISTISFQVNRSTKRRSAIIKGDQTHDDVIKWKHFPRYWPFVRGIHRSPVNSPHKGQWRGALIFSLICVWINGWVNSREAGHLRRYRAHYDVRVMKCYLKSQGPIFPGIGIPIITIVVRPSYLYDGNSYTGKMTSLFWNGSQDDYKD